MCNVASFKVQVCCRRVFFASTEVHSDDAITQLLDINNPPLQSHCRRTASHVINIPGLNHCITPAPLFLHHKNGRKRSVGGRVNTLRGAALLPCSTSTSRIPISHSGQPSSILLHARQILYHNCRHKCQNQMSLYVVLQPTCNIGIYARAYSKRSLRKTARCLPYYRMGIFLVSVR